MLVITFLALLIKSNMGTIKSKIFTTYSTTVSCEPLNDDEQENSKDNLKEKTINKHFCPDSLILSDSSNNNYKNITSNNYKNKNQKNQSTLKNESTGFAVTKNTLSCEEDNKENKMTENPVRRNNYEREKANKRYSLNIENFNLSQMSQTSSSNQETTVDMLMNDITCAAKLPKLNENETPIDCDFETEKIASATVTSFQPPSLLQKSQYFRSFRSASRRFFGANLKRIAISNAQVQVQTMQSNNKSNMTNENDHKELSTDNENNDKGNCKIFNCTN